MNDAEPEFDPWNETVELDADDETTFWREQRAEPEHRPERSPWFTGTRANANRVMCRDCKRPIGETCTDRAGNELTRFPAHVHRIHDATAVDR